MNVVSRGFKNAFRSPLRSGAIIIMLAISIGLILSMLVARSSVNAKIDEVKASSGNSISISPAGIRGFAGGGDALTSDQLTEVTNTKHVSSVTATLTDQLGTSDTSLTPSLEFGQFGARQNRFESQDSSLSDNTKSGSNQNSDAEVSTEDSNRQMPGPRTVLTGTTDPDSVSTDGGSLNIASGKTIDGNSKDLIALVGTDLATKNNLEVGDTFTAYEKTITVQGIFETDNTFQDSGLIMPLATVQTLTDQSNSISSIIAKVDSSENVETVVSSLESSLGDKVDVTSQAEQAESSVSSLKSISSLALAGVIGATISGAIIILLAMIMIVRERRREIGVIKAIGGSDGKVIAQFVTEALSLTLASAIIGLALGVLVCGPMTTSLVSSSSNTSSSVRAEGIKSGGPLGMMRGGMSQINNNFSQITGSLTPETFAIAIGMTLLIAIVGSAVPAWLIAKVRPAEVLRTE